MYFRIDGETTGLAYWGRVNGSAVTAPLIHAVIYHRAPSPHQGKGKYSIIYFTPSPPLIINKSLINYVSSRFVL